MKAATPFSDYKNLIAPVYYKNCPIRHTHENMLFSYHMYSTRKEPREQMKHVRLMPHHVMIFLFEGELHLYWDEHVDIVVRAGEFFVLPRGAEVSAYIVGDVSYVEAIIERGMTAKELDDLRAMANYKQFEQYKLKPLVMHPMMQSLAESVRDYLVNGVNCAHLHEAKSAELYVILHWYYSIADNAQLFYPVAGAVSQFRDFILDNYKINTSIDELVEKANMSRSTFTRKFKEAFRTTPLKWIDELTRQTITHKASEPNVTVKDIMYEVGISNPSQFTQLCKRLCGVIPSELIKSK